MNSEQLPEQKGGAQCQDQHCMCQAHLNLTEGAQRVVPGRYQVVQDAV